jgi:hypothetical protein
LFNTSRNSPPFKETEGSLPYSQKPNESSPQPATLFFKSLLNIIPHLYPGLPNGVTLSGISYSNVSFLISPCLLSVPPITIVLDFIKLIKSVKGKINMFLVLN